MYSHDVLSKIKWVGPWIAAVLLVGPALAQPAPAPVEPFTFIQISDSHFSPQLARIAEPVAMRGKESVAWINQQAVGEQQVAGWKGHTPAPSFALLTGDIFEYGAIDQTWQQFDQAFADLPFPVYVIPGNHDNTWVALYRIMRQRHGGENYTFEKNGIKFLNLCSASPQEPVPSLDGKTRAWLRAELEQTSKTQPLIITLHHPLGDTTMAPAEYATLYDLIRDYNVVFVLYGHGHALRHKDYDGLDGIMGGSTFGPNSGYAVYDFEPDIARVAYHYYRDPKKKEDPDNGPVWRKVLSKKIETTAPQRLFAIQSPAANAFVQGDTLNVVLDGADETLADATWTFEIDGETIDAKAVDGKALCFELPLSGDVIGWRRLTARVKAGDGEQDLRTVAFHYGSASAPWRWRETFPTAIKAAPTLAGDEVLIAGTDGILRSLSRRDGSVRWTFATEGEILSTPVVTDERIIFGSGDGAIYALDRAGKLVWKEQVGAAVYGWPVVQDGVVFIGDNLGRVHARAIADGAKRWTFARADFGIESFVCVWDELVVFGAWDGYLYAVDRETGDQVWKVLGPKSSEGRGIRYYAPADCGPVVLGDRLCVTDRGYVLATYNKAGELAEPLELSVAGIAPTHDGQALLARAINDRVLRFDANGQQVWETKTPAGRFPIPPTDTRQGVVVCSNKGLLQLLDSTTGKVTWKYQTNSGWYVMAPVSVDNDGVAYVASMNGDVTAIPMTVDLAAK